MEMMHVWRRCDAAAGLGIAGDAADVDVDGRVDSVRHSSIH